MKTMLENRVRFRHLQAFLEVARQKSVARAAELLHVSPPAVTKTLRELEDALGQTMVERDGRGIRVTRMGEVFLHHAGTAVAALRQGEESMRRGDAASRELVRVGALPTVSARVMPGAISLFLAEDTNTAIKIVTGENAVLLQQLRDGALDIVVGRLAAPEKMAGLFFEHLYSEQVLFVVRAGHPLLAGGRDALARLGDFPVLMPTRESVIRPYVERLFLTNGMTVPATGIETVSEAFGRGFLARSDAVWIISKGVVANELREGTFVALPVDTEQTKGPVGLTMRADAAQSAGFTALLQAIRVAAAQNA
jgi:LysR family pca operon transcriptional activator